jgi:non-ribosomal peptide synthetase component E (peptide arylation enzyme)
VRETLSVAGVANAWGLTEFPVVTSPPPDGAPEVLDHTVGRPVPGVTVRVVDDSEREAAPGQEGELRLKGPQCFLGYVDASLNADAFDADGWFRSGDRGRIDPDGNVVVTGRIKDAIIRNAENISAQEIEGALVTHPAVADVAVIGVPDSRTGERVCAVVVAAPGGDVTLGALTEHCAAQGLSRHKSPERLELVDALPRNLTGKVLKNELRARFCQPTPGP